MTTSEYLTIGSIVLVRNCGVIGRNKIQVSWESRHYVIVRVVNEDGNISQPIKSLLVTCYSKYLRISRILRHNIPIKHYVTFKN